MASPATISAASAAIFETVNTLAANVPGFTPSTLVSVTAAIVIAAAPSGPPTPPIGTKRARYPAKLSATAAIAPLAMRSRIIHPCRNATSGPNASRMYTYGPPASGSIAPSSAKVSAPASATRPPPAQTPRIHADVGSARPTSAGVKKIPLPMMPPTTSNDADASPSSRRSAGAGAGAVI